jgi:rubrerythrin
VDGRTFVERLKSENEELLRKLDQEPVADPQAGATLGALLQIALKNEIEAAEIAAAWVPDTRELEAKLVFAEHAGDEARHFRLLESHVRALGIPLGDFRALDPPSPVLDCLRALRTTVERVAAALVAREAMGARRNRQFLKWLEAVGRKEIAQLYRDVINPDEERHHQAGCELLARLATTPEAQESARRAATRLLEIGDRARETLLAKTGAPVVPGC